ncbi:hypothetical protein [Sphingomonas immobilis]|uniref:Uncharacterized protein n=1 Tax=Sphingomonas immobilis TaxID=3063997 RepID=A0ABT9A0M5_9SPHN|nr:hypothetical protein [Sphingomonas sp. CA1-15]MDO7843389.1 hypothetical protein [Sphingomonas sp. CA1-15]
MPDSPPAIDDAAIAAWACAIGLETAMRERPQEIHDAARAALTLGASLARLEAAMAEPPPPLAP